MKKQAAKQTTFGLMLSVKVLELYINTMKKGENKKFGDLVCAERVCELVESQAAQ